MAEAEIKGIDGTVRKAHYGAGKQPWDVWKENGWAPVAAASNVHKYIKRHTMKNGADDLAKARWYFAELKKLSVGGAYCMAACQAIWELEGLLTNEELALLNVA